jgi:hypothetical protein
MKSDVLRALKASLSRKNFEPLGSILTIFKKEKLHISVYFQGRGENLQSATR